MSDTPKKRSKRWWRVILLLSAGGGMALAVVAFNYFWLARPVGGGPAGPSVAREAFASLGRHEKYCSWASAIA